MDIKKRAIGIFIAVIIASSVFAAVVIPVSASDSNCDLGSDHQRVFGSSPDGEMSGTIPCCDVCPAPDDDIYTISLTSESDIDISVRDAFLEGDRLEVWVDGNLIGTTPDMGHCGDGSGIYSSGTFSVKLSAGDHTLQFKNTCAPCFTGDPPCYDDWLPSGFYFSWKVVPKVPTLTPIGLIALAGLLSVVAAMSITLKRKRR
ncbi:hypothetical protein C5S35_00735 [Candidatus Methanophagaceae archaeon]|nr:hypothetical protein C5S35_00735 [Methanophagales archaeon]